MAATAISDVFVPEVIGDIATNILFGLAPLLRSGYVRNAGRDVWQRGGNTVTFPYWKRSDTTVVQANPGATRSGVTPSKIEMDTYTETLLSKICSFDFDKNAFDDIDASADPNAQIARLVAEDSAQAIQDTLVASAEGTDLELDITNESTASNRLITVDNIAAAKQKWGEHASMGGRPALFAHSSALLKLMQSSDFKTLSSAATTALVQAGVMVPDGTVGMVHGCWVVEMDSVTTVSSATVSSLTQSGGTATLTTSAAHGLNTGESITISGADQAGYNGTFTIVSVPSATTFTFAVDSGTVSPATGTLVLTIPTRYTNLLIKPEALGLYVKKAVTPNIKDVHPGTTLVTADFDFRYLSTLYRKRPRGVVKLKSL